MIVAPRTWEVDTGPTSPSTPTPATWQTFMSNSSYTKVLLDLHKCAGPSPYTLLGHSGMQSIHAQPDSVAVDVQHASRTVVGMWPAAFAAQISAQ